MAPKQETRGLLRNSTCGSSCCQIKAPSAPERQERQLDLRDCGRWLNRNGVSLCLSILMFRFNSNSVFISILCLPSQCGEGSSLSPLCMGRGWGAGGKCPNLQPSLSTAASSWPEPPPPPPADPRILCRAICPSLAAGTSSLLAPPPPHTHTLPNLGREGVVLTPQERLGAVDTLQCPLGSGAPIPGPPRCREQPLRVS